MHWLIALMRVRVVMAVVMFMVVLVAFILMMNVVAFNYKRLLSLRNNIMIMTMVTILVRMGRAITVGMCLAAGFLLCV
jgi:hypothetical protein